MPAHTPSLKWNTFEHEHIERGNDWYWALGIVAVSIALTAIILHNIFFGLLIIVAAVSLGLISSSPPDLSHIELSDRGIRVNGVLHRWDHIISFWVEDEHTGRPLLLVDTTKFLSPNLIIPIEGVEPSHVRALLKEHAKEKHMHEPMAHKILDFLGL